MTSRVLPFWSYLTYHAGRGASHDERSSMRHNAMCMSLMGLVGVALALGVVKGALVGVAVFGVCALVGLLALAFFGPVRGVSDPAVEKKDESRSQDHKKYVMSRY